MYTSNDVFRDCVVVFRGEGVGVKSTLSWSHILRVIARYFQDKQYFNSSS